MTSLVRAGLVSLVVCAVLTLFVNAERLKRRLLSPKQRVWVVPDAHSRFKIGANAAARHFATEVRFFRDAAELSTEMDSHYCPDTVIFVVQGPSLTGAELAFIQGVVDSHVPVTVVGEAPVTQILPYDCKALSLTGDWFSKGYWSVASSTLKLQEPIFIASTENNDGQAGQETGADRVGSSDTT